MNFLNSYPYEIVVLIFLEQVVSNRNQVVPQAILSRNYQPSTGTASSQSRIQSANNEGTASHFSPAHPRLDNLSVSPSLRKQSSGKQPTPNFAVYSCPQARTGSDQQLPQQTNSNNVYTTNAILTADTEACYHCGHLEGFIEVMACISLEI